MVSGLLLIALTFFVFAQAASLRGGGQSAADAAALAAAQEARDRLFEDLLDAVDTDGGLDLGGILDGDDFDVPSACQAAERLAARNGATLQECGIAGGRAGYEVRVLTDDAIGESVIPGTEGRRAEAGAVAVIEGLCTAPEPPPEEPEEPDDPDEEPPPDEDDGGEADEPDPVQLDCGDDEWSIDPDNEDELPDPRDLFHVYLED
ncbi:hypothetical protein [Streptomyces avicenniae]|uniref:hypothetical protein n=1 Tax=Streptomyces avicenniae TaxID=500153 RepID=UPI000699C2B9|nr:hypothetical protein [Streptomyces avicenniae]